MYFQDKGLQINQMYVLLPDLILCSNCHQIKNSWHLLYNSAQVIHSTNIWEWLRVWTDINAKYEQNKYLLFQTPLIIINQIKSNHLYCHITTAHVPWWVKFLRACSRQCSNNLHIDSTYLQTYTNDNVQYTVHIHIVSTHSVLLDILTVINTHSYTVCTHSTLCTHLNTVICKGATDYT